MTEIINPPVINQATKSQKIEYAIYFIFGAIEVLLAFRLILKITGANLASDFVKFIYGITGIFTLPFQGIFRQTAASTSIFEPATLFAIFVYIILAWGIVKLVRISSGEQQES